MRRRRLETTELLGGLLGRLVLGDLKDVETNSLGERSALADGDGVANLDTESGRNVGGNVLVALLVSRVLGDKVKVLSADDDGTGHLGGDNLTGQDTATDGNETSPGALLVCLSVPESNVKCKMKKGSVFRFKIVVCSFASLRLIGIRSPIIHHEQDRGFRVTVKHSSSSNSERELVGSSGSRAQRKRALVSNGRLAMRRACGNKSIDRSIFMRIRCIQRLSLLLCRPLLFSILRAS